MEGIERGRLDERGEGERAAGFGVFRDRAIEIGGGRRKRQGRRYDQRAERAATALQKSLLHGAFL
jgi:hypothetical protein